MPCCKSVRCWSIVVLTSLTLSGCQFQHNYTTVEGPRYAGMAPPHVEPPRASDTLRIASFNIEYALRVDSALAVIRAEPELRNADIILLQEMDAPSSRYMARELGMWFVYYPSSLHIMHKRDFGNAVLSRFPIVADRKLLLPHHARFVQTARTATAATVRVGDTDVRVYSAHLGTLANITRNQRRDQLRVIMEDAKGYARVVLGGDMNDASMGELARESGYSWPTEKGPRTAAIGRLDHIFLKGLFIADSAGAGTVQNVREASDHRPIWALALMRK